MEPEQNKSVLIVEDDPFISIAACEEVLELGVDCLTAYDCASANRIVETQGCSCALLDFDLRGETSLPVARKLERSGTPFSFVTGRSIDEVIEAYGLEARVFTKPVNYAEIARKLLKAA